MKIAIDLDEVMAGLLTELNKYYNLMYGTNFKFEDYKSYDLEKTWGGFKQRAVDIVTSFYNHPLFDNILPIEDSQQSIQKLSKYNELIVITSRPEMLRRKTENWIIKYYSRNIEKIILTGQYVLDSSQFSKSDTCLDEEANVIIEDSFEIANKCSTKGILSFLFDRPWNQNSSIINDNLIRVKNWNEILEKIK